VAFADPDMTPSASADPVAHAEAVAAVALSLRPWESTSMFWERAAVRLPIRRQRTSKINSGLFEYLRGDFASPCKANGQLGDDSVLSDHEDTAGGLTPLPGVLKALMRSKLDHGTVTVGSLFLEASASVTNRRHWL
jgi:hypothetical protein